MGRLAYIKPQDGECSTRVLKKVPIVRHGRPQYGEEKSALMRYRWVPSTHFKGDSKLPKKAIRVLAIKVVVWLGIILERLMRIGVRLMSVSRAVLARFMHQVMLCDVRNQRAR